MVSRSAPTGAGCGCRADLWSPVEDRPAAGAGGPGVRPAAGDGRDGVRRDRGQQPLRPRRRERQHQGQPGAGPALAGSGHRLQRPAPQRGHHRHAGHRRQHAHRLLLLQALRRRPPQPGARQHGLVGPRRRRGHPGRAAQLPGAHPGRGQQRRQRPLRCLRAAAAAGAAADERRGVRRVRGPLRRPHVPRLGGRAWGPTGRSRRCSPPRCSRRAARASGSRAAGWCRMGRGGSSSSRATGSWTRTRRPQAKPTGHLSQSVVRLQVQGDGSLRAMDFFAPYNRSTLDLADTDFGSGAPVALPSEYFGTTTHPRLLVASGKAGRAVPAGPGGSGRLPSGLGRGRRRAGRGERRRGHVVAAGGVSARLGWCTWCPTASRCRRSNTASAADGRPTLSEAGRTPSPFGYTSGSPIVTSDGTRAGSALVWVTFSTSTYGDGQLRAYDAVPDPVGPAEPAVHGRLRRARQVLGARRGRGADLRRHRRRARAGLRRPDHQPGVRRRRWTSGRWWWAARCPGTR